MSLTRSFPSRSRPGVVYHTSLGPNGLVSCTGSDGDTCPGHRRYIRSRGQTRECWHILELREEQESRVLAGELVHCARCGEYEPWPFDKPPVAGQSICGSCADDLRDEANARAAEQRFTHSRAVPVREVEEHPDKSLPASDYVSPAEALFGFRKGRDDA